MNAGRRRVCGECVGVLNMSEVHVGIAQVVQ
jgi:hypothetical protein